MSPVHSTMVRKCRPSRFSTSSAQAVMRSCSASDCSGVAIDTSSTFSNWCWRIMPRVSLPAAPASARKHSVPAVKRSGSFASSTMLSRTRLVIGTSAVGISQKPSPAANWSSRNFGNCAVPNIASSRTSTGGLISS